MSIGRFYAGVAGLVWSPANEKYLLLQRSAEKDFAAGIWECVTGRVDQGEGFEEALRREIDEEIGVSEVAVEFIIGTTHFYRGPAAPENELLGIIYACAIQDPDAIQISPEHADHRWVTVSEARQLLTASDPSTQWTLRVMERAELIRAHLPAVLGDIYRQYRFELD